MLEEEQRKYDRPRAILDRRRSRPICLNFCTVSTPPPPAPPGVPFSVPSSAVSASIEAFVTCEWNCASLQNVTEVNWPKRTGGKPKRRCNTKRGFSFFFSLKYLLPRNGCRSANDSDNQKNTTMAAMRWGVWRYSLSSARSKFKIDEKLPMEPNNYHQNWVNK